jgi:uncharacterized membrane protein
MKALLAKTVGALSLLLPGAAFAQSGNMMNGGASGGGWMGGYGGAWMPTLLLVAVVALVVWVVTQKRK